MRLNHLETSGTSEQLQGFAYQHDRVGNIVSIDDLLHSDSDAVASAALNANANYTYDAWYRLVASEFTSSAISNSTETINYTYNSIDNILSRTSSMRKLIVPIPPENIATETTVDTQNSAKEKI
ncbi:MAG: hypothetical protein JW841_16355, partial [Deltaproteobacteria bacterium]|nr:hypothetical protein [Deltaproteobacteria bacterium]